MKLIIKFLKKVYYWILKILFTKVFNRKPIVTLRIMFIMFIILLSSLNLNAQTATIIPDSIPYTWLHWDKFENEDEYNIIGWNYQVIQGESGKEVYIPKEALMSPPEPTELVYDYEVMNQDYHRRIDIPIAYNIEFIYRMNIVYINNNDTVATAWSEYSTNCFLKGDINDDKRVDGTDLNILRKYFRRSGVDYRIWADLTKDGNVNGDDLNELRKYMGSSWEE